MHSIGIRCTLAEQNQSRWRCQPNGATALRVFGSGARGDAAAGSDLDVLVEMGDGPSVFRQAALQSDLEDLLGCPVHVTTTSGLKYAREDARERIERKAVSL